MRAVGRKNTRPEMIVRRLVHSLGYRFRLHGTDLPGKPDMVFPARRKVVFVHGCFWHGHNCRRGARPASNTSYWHPKLARNAERDQAQLEALRERGWEPLVIWECATKDLEGLANELKRFLG